MATKPPFAKSFTELPGTVPLFVLSKAVVLPSGLLPLNVFEPRYLNMVRDALRSHQLIGMIQPNEGSATAQQSPTLYSIGCAGHIVRYQETKEGRIEIVLAGLCRFRIQSEYLADGGYRVGNVSWSEFESDMAPTPSSDPGLEESFRLALQQYMAQQQLKTDWTTLDQLNGTELCHNLLSFLPLSVSDKQLLIETKDDQDRIKAFTAILNNTFQVRPKQSH